MLTPSFPNMEGGWLLPARRAGMEILRNQEFDLIYSSAYPMASHAVALYLKKVTGLPWVADYRDEWSTRDVLRWPTRLHRRLARRLDAEVMRRADLIVTTSPAHTERLAREFAAGDTARFRTITNGFDEDDFSDESSAGEAPSENGFHLTHVGSVFRWRGAEAILEAAERLATRGNVPELTLHFVGHTGALRSPDLEARGLLKVHGYVTHAEAVSWMRSASALLLINTEATNILGKTFEYLAARRPVLAAVNEGPTADLIRHMGAGSVVAPDDPDAIAAAIQSLYDRWSSGELASPVVRGLERFSRRVLAGQLADAFEDVV
jgi:glycosyltransferase involved in cell wall biosynthesis